MEKNATYPGYIGISDVTSQSFEQMRVEGYFEGQTSIMYDEPEGFDIGDPPDLQGRSRGWSPVHAQLSALVACTSITVRVVARDQGFKYQGVRTDVRSLIDIRGFFFDLHLQPKYEQINFDLFVDSREKVERVKELARETDRRCPQIGLFRLAGIPMVMSWYREGSKKPLFEERFHIGRGKTPEEKLIETNKKLAARKAKSRA
ncbi:MAG: OsmC family protein [Rhodospirillaceae bacterium]